MIPDNPNTRRTYKGEHPTPEQVRAIVRYEFQEATILRYSPDEALDCAADAVHAAFPPAAEALQATLYQAEEERDNALYDLDQAEETIRSLRGEVARLQALYENADATITRLCKES